jgi:hypothetical protein
MFDTGCFAHTVEKAAMPAFSNEITAKYLPVSSKFAALQKLNQFNYTKSARLPQFAFDNFLPRLQSFDPIPWSDGVRRDL